MAEYIDINKLTDKLGKLSSLYGDDFYWETRRIVGEVPVLTEEDIKSVVRGKWDKDGKVMICNKCHTWYKQEREDYYNYCPYCGAEMGDEDDSN